MKRIDALTMVTNFMETVKLTPAFKDALEALIDSTVLVMNIDAVYNAQDSNEATIYVVQDILENYFKGGGTDEKD